MIERRSCPACFRVKTIPVPMPICRTCIQHVPSKLQAAYVTAIFAGDKKAQLRLDGEMVTAAWSAQSPQAPAAMSRGAR
jgi:hypothetical protein